MILGIKDTSVFLAYILSIVATIVCAVYGWLRWNKDGEITDKELKKEAEWTKEELKIDDELSDGGDL